MFGPDHPLVAVQLNDLALSLLLQGDYAGARPLQERALAVYERRLGPDHSYVTTTVFNLAILNLEIGDFAEASRLHRRALTTWARVVGADHPYVAFALLGFAQTLANRGEHRQALPLFARALAIRERTLGPSHPRVARTLTHLATSQLALGELTRASATAERALRIWEQSGEREGLAESLLVHARIQSARGDYLSAKGAYERALEIRLPVFGATHPSIGEAQADFAIALAGLRQSADALETSLRAEAIGREHLRTIVGYLPERQALGYAVKRPKGLDLALSLATDGEPGPLLDAVVRSRSLILDEIALRRRTRTATADATGPLWTALTSARQRLANLAIRGPSDANPAQYARLLDEARREKEAAERALAERSADFRSELARADVGLDQVRASLTAGSALVSFVRYDRNNFPPTTPHTRPPSPPPSTSTPQGRQIVSSYIAFVLREGVADPIAVPLGRAATTDALVARWRQAMMSGVQPGPTGPPPAESVQAAGAALRRRIWDPVAVHLQGVTRAYLVPDGTLNLVPFAALPIERGRFLLESGPTVHYLSAERDLVFPAQVDTSGKGLLAIGNPAFADGSPFAALASPRTATRALHVSPKESPPPAAVPSPRRSPTASFRGTGSTCGSFQKLRFEPLPASRREAENVAALWRNLGSDAAADPSAQLLTGRAADEPAFKRLGPGRRVLHLATHGFFLGGECASALDGSRGVGGLSTRKRPMASHASPENPLLLSGLVLAGANRRAAAGPDEDDGILTSEEVAAMDLEGVEWAVLSACDTGLGELRAGEGVFGLRRAFQGAGVRTVIMSLWSVEDQATRVWMRALYEARLKQKLDTADAVRHASLTMLRDRRARGQSTHPFYWASFVAAGDWR